MLSGKYESGLMEYESDTSETGIAESDMTESVTTETETNESGVTETETNESGVTETETNESDMTETTSGESGMMKYDISESQGQILAIAVILLLLLLVVWTIKTISERLVTARALPKGGGVLTFTIYARTIEELESQMKGRVKRELMIMTVTGKKSDESKVSYGGVVVEKFYCHQTAQISWSD